MTINSALIIGASLSEPHTIINEQLYDIQKNYVHCSRTLFYLAFEDTEMAINLKIDYTICINDWCDCVL